MLSEIQVAVDVGSTRHRVAIGAPDGKLLAEFDIPHTPAGFGEFFRRIERLSQQRPVAVAMEGYNGYARPLDRMILGHGFRLYSVNNLKLARYKEIFPAPAKTDAIDGRKILELFRLRDHVPLARDVLQEVTPAPPAHEKLKRLTRRRRQLVNEKVRLLNRLQADLQAVCPGLLQITGQGDNLWFLRFLICRGEITQLAHVRNTTLLGLAGVGKTYAAQIRAWQQTAQFSDEVAWVGPMIVADGRRVLALLAEIDVLDREIAATAEASSFAATVGSIPGFGATCKAELAGEIGTLDRFPGEASLALYLGMSALDNSSGKRTGTRAPRQVNTRAKAAMMVATVHHMACVPRSRAYYDKKRAEGKTHNQAVRALGRQLARVIWSLSKHQRHYEIR